MNKELMLKYLQEPEMLNRDTVSDLLAAGEEFPYCQTLRLLVLKNKFLTGMEYQSELITASAYFSDRKVLYDILFPLKKAEREAVDNVAQPAAEQPPVEIILPETADLNEKTQNLTDEQPDPRVTELLILQPDGIEPAVEKTADTATLPVKPDLLKQDETGSEAEFFTLEQDETASDKDELIDKFISANPKIKPKHDSKPVVDISAESVKENESVFTDTLAKIYIKQGYYSKAIFAYEKLILKFPEKSDYFATQIEEIKMLMNKM